MNNEVKDVIIIGAGLTGLTTTFYLKKRNKNFLVLEKNNRVGGVINTITKNGFTFEEGPNTGIISHPEVAELFEELGVDCIPEIAPDAVKKRYILKNHAWQALPSGLKKAIKTPLFTTKDKFGILLEPFRKRGNNPHETLAELVKRRLGKSFLDYAIDPFILGVYAGDPAKLVPKYALPKLYNLEQTYGSFIKGSLKKQFAKKDPRDKKATRKTFSVEGGLANLVQTLYKKSGHENFILEANNIVITPKDNLFEVTFSKNGITETHTAQKVITTTPAYSLTELLPFLNKEILQPVTQLKYAKVIQVSLGFNSWNGFPLDGFGGLIPYKESYSMLGVLFLSAFLKNRAPENGSLLSVFLGGVRNEDIIELDDDKIVSLIEKEFTRVMKINEFKPNLINIKRYQAAIPQYYADSGARFKAVDDIEKKYPGLIIAGNLKDGIGMADRIKQATTIANDIS